MKLRSARLFQQLRLWLYCLLLALVLIRAWGGWHSFSEFVLFCLLGALLYMEVCPVCGRLCWWELNVRQRWPNALWIGAECRRQHSEVTSRSTDT